MCPHFFFESFIFPKWKSTSEKRNLFLSKLQQAVYNLNNGCYIFVANLAFMFYQYIQPSALLAPYIKRYWMLETEVSEGDVCERVVPTENMELMFHYKKPFSVSHPQKGLSPQPQSLISGLSNCFFDVTTQGQSGVIAVDFYPYGACNFFRFPLNELQNQSIHLGDIFTNEIRYIEERICECHNLSSRIAVIEKFLIEKLFPVNTTDLVLIKNSVTLIKLNKGQIQAQQLSDKLSVSPKKLERKFSSLVGKSPKQFIKIVRFQEALAGLMQHQPQYLTEHAYNNGYFDQSHFIKEFKALSGYTPREFISQCSCRSELLIEEYS